MDGASDLLYERETTINMTDAEDVARVYTASPSWMRKFDRLCAEHPENFKLTGVDRADGRVTGKFYEMPKGMVTIRSKTRTYTEEQKAEMAARFRRAGNGEEA